MNKEDSQKQIVKLCFTVILLSLLSIRSGPISIARAQETAGHIASPMPSSTYVDLDDDATAWDVFEEGAPLWELNNVTDPSLDGRALRCAITGGDPYSNVHCYRNIFPGDSTSDLFSLSLSFQYRPASSFNNDGVPSIVQGLEFTMSKWENNVRYEWAVQWENVGTGAPKWRYWSPTPPIPDPPPPDAGQWVDLGISGEVSGMEWHTLKLEGEIFNGLVRYRRFIFDLQEFPLDITVPTASTVNELDRFAVAVQLDGNSTETPYELIIDNVRLVTTQTFSDVPLNYWAFNWIKRLYYAGITGGCSTNLLAYCPEQNVTRDQMAVFLERGIRGSSYTPPTATGTVFTDVPADYWAAAWIEKLAADGITAGCGAGNYCPESSTTRAEMAVFLLRAKYGAAYTPPAVGAATGFNDVPTDYWAAAWIKQLAVEGITGGCGTNLYCPENPVTRAQMGVFLVRTFNLP